MKSFLKDNSCIYSLECDELFDYHEKIEKICNDTGMIKKAVITYLDNWVYLNGEWYFFKPFLKDNYCSNFGAFNELLGEIICEYFELDTIKYTIAKYNNTYGLLSKCITNNKFKYIRVKDFFNPYYKDISFLSISNKDKFLSDLNRILEIKQEIKCNNYLELIKDLKKFFIMDFYSNQKDRFSYNFMFQMDNDNITLAKLHDFEDSFSNANISKYKNSLGILDLKNKDTLKLLQTDDYFQEQFYKIYRSKMKEFLNILEERFNVCVPKYYKNLYLKYEVKKKRILKKYKLI